MNPVRKITMFFQWFTGPDSGVCSGSGSSSVVACSIWSNIASIVVLKSASSSLSCCSRCSTMIFASCFSSSLISSVVSIMSRIFSASACFAAMRFSCLYKSEKYGSSCGKYSACGVMFAIFE